MTYHHKKPWFDPFEINEANDSNLSSLQKRDSPQPITQIKGVPLESLRSKKNDSSFNYSGFVDSLDSQELATLLDFMGNDPSMKGRVVEAAELVGMIPKIMKLGGLLPEDRQRVNTIFKNFTQTK